MFSLHSNAPSLDSFVPAIEPEADQRWSTWLEVPPTQRGPLPLPEWVVTDAAALDTELGVVKSGKEAAVYLIERAVPGHAGCYLAAKRFLGSERSDFHRPAVYTEGRHVTDQREARAIRRKTAFGRRAADGQWAFAEFQALVRAWQGGVPVPYPVQVSGTEILMEFIGKSGMAAPRLAQSKRKGAELRDAFDQVVGILESFIQMGYVHGDFSAYNLLDDGQRIVVIDLPQMVDVAVNPSAMDMLHRDVMNITDWFERRGLKAEPDVLYAELVGRMWS